MRIYDVTIHDGYLPQGYVTPPVVYCYFPIHLSHTADNVTTFAHITLESSRPLPDIGHLDV